MSTRFTRALLSCLFVQTFVAASVPVMALEPTIMNLGPGNSLSIAIDGAMEPSVSTDQDATANNLNVVVDTPKGWDQVAPQTTTVQPAAAKHANAPAPALQLRVNHPTAIQKKVEHSLKPKILGLSTLPCATADIDDTN